MAMDQPSELEQCFEKLQKLISQNEHGKIVKLTDTSELRLQQPWSHVAGRQTALQLTLLVLLLQSSGSHLAM
jgi:hypothetical protein